MKSKLMEVVSDNEHLSIDKINEGLASGYIKDWAYILHDKDIKEDGTAKNPHYHIALRLKYTVDSKYIAQAFGVPENFICRVKGKWVDILDYLTHSNAPNKHIYDVEEVKSNFDFEVVREKERKNKNNSNRLDEILTLIDDGTVKEYNIDEYITNIEYVKYNKQIKLAFEYRIKKLKRIGSNRNMKVMYMYGDSGNGKTTFAKLMCEQQNFDYFISSGNNDPFDGYEGQDAIILDDIRPDTFRLDDFLKILDNNTSSTVKSRYKNKFLECKLIIITNTLDIFSFYNKVIKDEDENPKQFFRRIKMCARVEEKEIVLSKLVLDRNEPMYVKDREIPNPVYYNPEYFNNITDKDYDELADLCIKTGNLIKDSNKLPFD